jgi:rod shape-determining protein MreC
MSISPSPRPMASPNAFDFALVQSAFQPPPEPSTQAEPAPGIDAP